MSVRTMYSYLNQGLFTTRDMDLKRKVRFKPRKCHKTQITNRTVFANRLYSDFCNLELPSYVEMDTVHSSRESKKTLLTLFFTKEKLDEISSLTVKRQVSVSGILKNLGVSRSGYNIWKKRVPSDTSVRRAV